MAKTSKTKKPSQRERFIQAAHEVGADEKEETFDRVLKKVASAPPSKDSEKRKSKKPAK
jgi:hypothetical protein